MKKKRDGLVLLVKSSPIWPGRFQAIREASKSGRAENGWVYSACSSGRPKWNLGSAKEYEWQTPMTTV